MNHPEYRGVCYCVNLRRGAAILTEYYDSALAESGLSVTQFCLLIHLRRKTGANMTQWAEAVGLERSTMVRNIRLLEQNGWIARIPGRGKCFALSPSGNAALERALPAWQETQNRLASYLTQEDADALLRISRKIQALPAMRAEKP